MASSGGGMASWLVPSSNHSDGRKESPHGQRSS